MIRLIISISLLFVVAIQGSAQINTSLLQGEITFITSSNVYVRFDDTKDIAIGDSLYLMSDQSEACLKVIQKSSSSCVTQRLNDCKLSKTDLIVYNVRTKPVDIKEEKIDELIYAPDEKETDEVPYLDTKEIVKYNKQKIRARASMSTYSNLSSLSEDKHRVMGRFSFRGDHINDSKFSIESYLNYRQNFSSGTISPDYKTKFFRVYNLALSYDIDSTMSISLGRKINRKMSSVGAIDGLQLEKQFGQIYSGLVLGFRPDISDYGFNSDLLEYGLFAGVKSQTGQTNSETTIGILEQRNGGEIDRRYSYVQHRSNLTRQLNLFASAELDLYSRLNTVESTEARLTNFYVSSRYRFNRKISVSLSFDSRRRIIYYETLRTEVERLLADDQARQGIRLRLNLRPFNYIFGSFSFSKRKQSDGTNNSDNINAMISHSNIPGIGGRLSITANRNQSDYLRSRIVSLRHNRTLLNNKIGLSLYYRLVNYTYLSSEINLNQYYYGANLSFKLTRDLAFNFLAELSTTDKENKYRFNSKLIKRFGR